MDLTLTDEQLALRATVQAVLGNTHSAPHVAELADGDSGWDESVWSTFAQMGLLGLSVPEGLGGMGATLVEEVILFEEAGAALLPGPLFSTVALALPALLSSPLASELVPEVVSGDRRLAFAWADPGCDPFLTKAVETSFIAVIDESVGVAVLNGTKQWVMDVQCADSIIVAAKTNRGAGLFLADLTQPGIRWVEMGGVDGTRRMFTVSFESVTARSLVDVTHSGPVFEAIWRRGLLLASAEAVGSSARLLEISAQYASTREQFGRPIGTYQAVSHQIADMYMHTELARSLCFWGALELDAGSGEVDAAVRGAASVVLPGAVASAERAIQIFGGVGMTWESVLHRYLRRALQMNALDSPPHVQRCLVSSKLFDE